ncbi:ATP-binding protein [Caedibacter taeniospiralis]|uniref:ATP-binding protein n=1 Tax=Caedibacter taeniospiralis TaxID=28907 RepID=UPI000C27AAEB|nr:ATP-binding protein [Caedibacter taeniospiralis]
MKKLPIGISGLEKIITGNYVYVDKTRHIAELAHGGGGYYFLSRPRRFGKSLLIDTIKQAFLGNKDLFNGLYLENNWDWDVSYPVLHFTFGEGNAADPEALDAKITKFLDAYYESYQIQNIYDEISSRFAYLIEQLARKSNKVVILVDEYDKPILDNVDNTEIAKAMRGRLRNFYSVIKSQDVNVKFAMLTGVSRFSKISIFSELNNLKDITLDKRYADICGYNQSELEHSFNAYLTEGQVDLKQLKKWYNGYNFTGIESQKVYNPFDILLFIDGDYQYQSYWFETATPTFLVKMIEKSRYFIPDLEDIVVGEEILKTFDIETMPIETLLFQTGYLTIKEITSRGQTIAYRLSYPNYEVKYSLNNALAVIASNQSVKNMLIDRMLNVLEGDDFKRLELLLSSHFASIPHDWYRNNQIDQYEGFYASVVYSFLTALGYDTIPEDVTNHGKIDLTIIMHDKIVIIEFKLAKLGDAKSAIQQIKDKKYAEKYLSINKPIYLIGMSFDPIERNVMGLAVEHFIAKNTMKYKDCDGS